MNLVDMSDVRRALILKLADDYYETLPILHSMTRWVRCDEVFKWLIDSKLTGKNFLAFHRYSWSISTKSMVEHILMKIDKDIKTRPTLAVKDYLV